MPSDRVQRRIDRLLDEAEQLLDAKQWQEARELARQILLLDSANPDALAFLATADGMLGAAEVASSVATVEGRGVSYEKSAVEPSAAAAQPVSFAAGRYAVKKFLGEGGKKKVYLAHDELLDRNVAFALIKTEGLNEVGRHRITREAQAMGRLGAHPHIVSVFDLGEETNGQPYIVTELMGGGDVEGLIEKALEHRPSLERTLEISIAVCRGLEFAHGQGIVHRDLKPGNVWLTADGTAKLGDFGLAVALDKSRLTQGGMMVGTVLYMPPEQAMGGAVTPQADLYSLGAMLYEMLTGRPPFVGDESVAIITQHLNVSPVSPSWHNPVVPPALEALVLRLLEKDPSKRPESANAVCEVLERIRSTALPATPAQDSPEAPAIAVGDNPMYRRTFVGREPELRALQAAYDAAMSGQGSLVTVVGEPGIGKTSLCEQLATHATIRGGKTLAGHCYEEGSLSLPYLAFVEALRSYVLAREPDGLRQDLGSGAAEVGRIISEVRERLNIQPSPPNLADPEEERYRLYQAVTSFLRSAATVQPLVVVLEDLHDADRGTLDLLLHLFRNLAGSRLLIVGTYRDIEVDRTHPLSATLAELRRGATFQRVLLRGLTADEVQRMLGLLSGQDISWGLAEAVHRQTEGNPLFIQEVLRYLVEEGLIKREGGHWRRASSDTPLEMGIPEGLRDVIGKRLSRLSPDCNRLLAVAAVIGRDFRLDTLQAVAGVEEEPLLAALEEATRIAVLQEQARVGVVQYRFAHAFFRQTLYAELSAPRRLRLHQAIARALERQYSARLEEHAAELAEHFAQSTDAADLAKAVQYAELAAARAIGVCAYGEAVRHLEQALEVQEVLNPDDEAKRCDLLLALSEALIPAGEPRRVVDQVAPAALRIAEGLGDAARAARLAGTACNAVVAEGGAMYGPAELQKWAEVADRYAAPETPMRVRADMALAAGDRHSSHTGRARARYAAALELARRVSDPEMLFYAAATNVGWTIEGEGTDIQLAEEFTTRSREGVSTRTLAFLLHACARAFLNWGHRDRAEAVWQEVIELSDRSHDPLNALRPFVIGAVLAVLDGRLEDALEAAADLRSRVEQIGVETSVKENADFLSLRRVMWVHSTSKPARRQTARKV